MIEGRHFAARQSQGDRDYQEDNWGYFSRLEPEDENPEGLMVVLSDGMGGHKGGAHASAVVVDAFLEFYRAGDAPPMETLRAALEDGNRRISEDGEANEDLEGMGCTVVGVEISKDGARWISVGDSPMWLVRDGKLERLNEDHSMAPLLQKQVEAGEMTEEDARRHPQRNALRSALVGEEPALVDESENALAFKPGDRLIIASDGLESLSEDEILAIATRDPSATSEAIATELVAAVDKMAKRGQDNTTVVVITPFDAPEKVSMFGRTLVPMLLVGLLIGGGALGGYYLFGDQLFGTNVTSGVTGTGGTASAGTAGVGSAGSGNLPAGVIRKEAEKSGGSGETGSASATSGSTSGSTAGAGDTDSGQTATTGEGGSGSGGTGSFEGSTRIKPVPAKPSAGKNAVANPEGAKTKAKKKKKPTQGLQNTVPQGD